MAKDSVKKRLETGDFFYRVQLSIVQGYDFYWLYKNHNCKVQMGGSDQWGNIVTGTELIRRMEGGSAFAITSPLIQKQMVQNLAKQNLVMYGLTQLKHLLINFTNIG